MLGLNKEYVEQLKAQLDLQFKLTLQFMNEDPMIDTFDMEKLEELVKKPKAERDRIREHFTETINSAIERAKEIARKERPITAYLGVKT